MRINLSRIEIEAYMNTISRKREKAIEENDIKSQNYCEGLLTAYKIILLNEIKED